MVDALEVTRGDFGRTIRFTLNVVARDTRSAPAAKDSEGVGTLPPKVIKELIRAHFPRFRSCYEQRLASIPDLSGTVSVRYIIDENGAVSSAEIDEAGTTIHDAEMRACVRDAYRRIRYPPPVGGKVMVTYPITFTME